jgi:hypothetical protein
MHNATYQSQILFYTQGLGFFLISACNQECKKDNIKKA